MHIGFRLVEFRKLRHVSHRHMVQPKHATHDDGELRFVDVFRANLLIKQLVNVEFPFFFSVAVAVHAVMHQPPTELQALFFVLSGS